MSASAALEAQMRRAVEEGDMAGVVLAARSVDGSLNYTAAFGRRTLEDSSSDQMETSTTIQLASLTKLLTTIAALQQVERGTLSLDASVLGQLPELAEAEVLTGFDSKTDAPVLKPRQRDITLRHLLTHSSGMGYTTMNAAQMRFFAGRGERPPAEPTVAARYARCPLSFEPGAAWEYSPGLDWAGLLVERTTSTDLDSYFETHLLRPLGLPRGSITFWLARNVPHWKAKRAGMTMRDKPDARVRHTARDVLNDGAEAAFGGHGAFGTVPAYAAVLASLADPKDSRLLGREAKAAMFQPALEPQAEQALNDILIAAAEGTSAFIGELPADRIRYTWGLGGILSLAPLKGWRGSHALLWSGLPNELWVVDPERGVSFVFGTQVLPPGDLKVARHIRAFEDWVYGQLPRKEAGKL